MSLVSRFSVVSGGAHDMVASLATMPRKPLVSWVQLLPWVLLLPWVSRELLVSRVPLFSWVPLASRVSLSHGCHWCPGCHCYHDSPGFFGAPGVPGVSDVTGACWDPAAVDPGNSKGRQRRQLGKNYLIRDINRLRKNSVVEKIEEKRS